VRAVVRSRAVAGGGRAVEVEPERVTGWFDRFAHRHGGIAASTASADLVTVTAADGATATVTVPFGPLVPPDDPRLAVAVLSLHVLRPRRVGLLLVRLGGHSVGIAYDGRIEQSRTDRRPVQGRTAAGGWSQSRFARRREGQARTALQAAATDVLELLVPRLSTLDGIVLGGDIRALGILRVDTRFAELFARAEPRILDIPEPRRSVLDEVAQRARSVEIVVNDDLHRRSG
jgi:hypothetical protein